MMHILEVRDEIVAQRSIWKRGTGYVVKVVALSKSCSLASREKFTIVAEVVRIESFSYSSQVANLLPKHALPQILHSSRIFTVDGPLA